MPRLTALKCLRNTWQPELLLLRMWLVLGLIMSGITPPGMMASASDNGLMSFEICSDGALSSHSIKKMFLTADGKLVEKSAQVDDSNSDSGKAKNSHCPYAVHSLATLVKPPQLTQIEHVDRTANIAQPDLAFLPGVASPLPPATGPPSFS